MPASEQQLRIVLAPSGSRGDVQPLVALGLALKRRGHQVTLAAPTNFERWVRSHGLEFASAGPDIRAAIEQEGDRLHYFHHQLRYLVDELVPDQFRLLPQICTDADIIVGAGLQLGGPSVAEYVDTPYVFVAYAPVVLPTSYYPPAVVRSQKLPRFLNSALWRLWDLCVRATLGASIADGRSTLNLAPVRNVAEHLRLPNGTIVLAADAALSGIPPDLPPNVRLTPALRLDDVAPLGDDVLAFLESGDAPVLVGFGSMISRNPTQLIETFVEAAEHVGCRLLIQSGWTGIDASDVRLPSTCLLIGSAPHPVLLPRVNAVVHHGGAGTTTAVARAGRPQMILPHILDQFFWAHRVETLGLGPAGVPVRRIIRASSLAMRLEQLVGNGSFETRARELAERTKHHGNEDAARIVEALARR